MALKKYNPTTPGRRHRIDVDTSDLDNMKIPRGLLVHLKTAKGRNNLGRITAWQRGGGSKRQYRLIDFKRRDKEGIEASVESIQYDPNRSARIALLKYVDGDWRFILSPLYLRKGYKVMSGPKADIRPGNAMELKAIPLGTMVHGIELRKGKGAQLVRTAGGNAQVMAKDEKYVHIKLPSGEVRLVHAECYASIGQLGNVNHENVKIGKAGRNRWKGKRPNVRGSAMNPVDHPHGGGEGRTTGGRHPVTPWGVSTKGKRTRTNKRSTKFIVKRRK